MRRHKLRCLLRKEWPLAVLAARGTIAALAALAVAVLLELECPYWAAMTALIVIQPTRGLLLEKSFYRLVGTAMGAAAGLLMLLASHSPVMLTIMLSLWLAGCVGTGNVLYGLRSYGALVAGCTGAVVAMAGYSNPPHLQDLVFGRVACIVIGIVVSTTVTLFFTRHNAKRELLNRLTKVVVADMEWLILLVRGATDAELAALRQDILMETAEIEGALDAAWAGSLDLKRRKRRVRSLIVSLLSLLEAGKLAGDQLARQTVFNESWRKPLAARLEEFAGHIDKHGMSGLKTDELTAALTEMRARLPLPGETLGELINSLQLVTREWDALTPGTERADSSLFIRHRDWQEAGRAALRALSAILAVGMAWALTGWTEGPLMLMAASIMVSIFSTHDRPSVMLNHIFLGASTGVVAGLFCRLILLPGVSGPLAQGILCIPVFMAGIIALYHRKTARGAMDAMLFFLFVMQPGLPAVPAPAAFIMGGFACLGGIGVAIFFFRFLLPIDPARRLSSILVAVARDLILMGTADLPLLEKCRARTHHRVLRMLVNAGKLGDDLRPIVEGGLAALAIARCVQRLRETEIDEGISLVASGAIRETALKLSIAIQRPDEILPVLEEVSTMLCRTIQAHQEPCNAPLQPVLPVVAHGLRDFSLVAAFPRQIAKNPLTRSA